MIELRRDHPRWGPRRLAYELARKGSDPVPSRSSIYRILVRSGLVEPRARRPKRSDRLRWERARPIWARLGGLLIALVFAALGCGRTVGPGDVAASRTTAPSAATAVTPAVADGPVRFSHRRLPSAITCPTGELQPLADEDPRLQGAAQTFLEAALLPGPDPRTMWGLMDPSLQALFESYEDFARQVEEASFDPDYAEWEVAGYHYSDPELETEGEPGLPWAFSPWLVSQCDQTTLEALRAPRAWAEVGLYWPRLFDEGLSIGVTQLFFLGRPEGPKLWVVYH